MSTGSLGDGVNKAEKRNGFAFGKREDDMKPNNVVTEFPTPPADAPSGVFLSALAEMVIRGYLVEVTPDLAAQWLRANTGNRPVREAHVRSLAEEISADRWKVTHQGIAFSTSGRLMDGQHRLRAVIRADTATRMCVFVGLDDDMFGALDRGARRTVADELRRDSRIVEPCSWITRLFRRGDRRPPSPAEVADIFDLYATQAAALLEAVSGCSRRASAGVKAALLIRLRDATPEQQTLLLAQWKAFAHLDTEVMDATSGAMLRRLETCLGGTSGAVEERGAVAWSGFNPRARALKRIQINDLGHELEEMRSAVTRHQRDRAEQAAQR